MWKNIKIRVKCYYSEFVHADHMGKKDTKIVGINVRRNRY